MLDFQRSQGQDHISDDIANILHITSKNLYVMNTILNHHVYLCKYQHNFCKSDL
jgi:hypothetical protein